MARLKVRHSTHSAAASADSDCADACLVRTLRDGTLLAAVADGVGSARAGGEAARRALDMLADYFEARPNAWTPRRALAEFVDRINRQLFQESSFRFDGPELVTTLCAVALSGGRLYGVNLGDSPALLLRGGQLQALSEDHVSPHAGQEHVLTRALGLADEAKPHFFERDLTPGDRLLLCTDGVSTLLDHPAITRLLSQDAAARAIVAEARNHVPEDDQPDDATAVAIEIIGHDDTVAEGQTLEVVPVLHPGDEFPDGRLIRPLDGGKRVWLAMGAGEQVVLKFPSVESADDEVRREGFLREAWQAGRLTAPEFVRSRVPASPVLRYYVQDYVPAPTLHQILRGGPLPFEGAQALAKFLVRSCQSLARIDLAHGDLKPENILVLRTSGAWDFRLIDLGSAAELFSVTSRAGTASYLAPERFHGAALSERTEIFTIGVILYESLTGKLPFGEIERFQTPTFALTPKSVASLNPVVPGWFDSLLLHALATAPAARYQHFSELQHDLANPLEVKPFHQPDAPLLERDPVRLFKGLCLLLLFLNILQFMLHRR